MVNKNNILNIGTYLRQKRIEAQIQQKELAKRLGCTAQFVANWENAKCNPPLRLLPKIVQILKISNQEFVDQILNQTKTHWYKVLKKKTTLRSPYSIYRI